MQHCRFTEGGQESRLWCAGAGVMGFWEGLMGKMESAVLAHRCMVAWGMLHVFRTNMGKLSLNVRGICSRRPTCRMVTAFSALFGVPKRQPDSRCWDSLLGFLNSGFVASFCTTLHFVQMADSRSTWSSSTSTFHVHIKPLVVCAAFYRFMSLKVQYVRAVFWGDLDKNRRLFRM